MDVIIDLSKRFRESVINLIINSYDNPSRLQIINIDNFKNINNKSLKHDILYIMDNYVLLSNRIIQILYNNSGSGGNNGISNGISNCNNDCNIEFDSNKFSIINIQYKNIKWRQRNNIKLCYLERRIREQNYQVLNSINMQNVNCDYMQSVNCDIQNINCDYIIMVGRKYHNKQTDDRNNHCFGILCIDELLLKNHLEDKINESECIDSNIEAIEHMENTERIESIDQMEIDEVNIDIDSESIIMIKNGGYRTKFLKQLKERIYGQEKRNFYIKNEIRRSIFLDVEFINDIYDDFETFPHSKDLSILFMIGVYYYDNTEKDFIYKNLVTKCLDTTNEYEILNQYLNIIENLININTGGKINIFHWSNADLWAINKCLLKYPDLHQKAKKMNIIYIDLLKIIKNIVKLESYSLKTVSKKLLERYYHTECQNGLDAMMNMISNSNVKINDLIEYNRLDTTIMYDIVKEFCKI